MPFNVTKCHAMAFNSRAVLPSYRLGTTNVLWVEETRYLGVTLQQNLKFDKHISEKVDKASGILGTIKHTIRTAPEKSKLLAYTSLCRPIMEYADTLWDPTDKRCVDSLEKIQSKAVRFIRNLKGRESVTEAKTLLGLVPLADRRKNHRVSLLMRILQDDQHHGTLSSAYDDIVTGRASSTMVTRAASRGELISIGSSTKHHGSFLPWTIRDMKYKPAICCK